MWSTKSIFVDTVAQRDSYDACTLVPSSMYIPLLDTMRNSHKIEVRIKVMAGTGGYPLFCNSAWVTPTWNIVSGDITESLDDEVTRSFSAEIVSDYWTSTNAILADLSPYKTMIRVERGVYTPYGIVYFPLGVYRLFDVTVKNGRQASISAYSQEADLRDHRYLTPPGVTSVSMTYESLLNRFGPVLGDIGATAPGIAWTGTPMQTTAGKLKIMPRKTTLTTARNRLELVKKLATSVGADFYFNRMNVPIIRAKPAFSDTVQLRINAASNDGTPEEPAILTSFDKKYTRSSVYNTVVATATDTAGKTTYRGVAYDTSTGPTRWGGPFGKKPRFFASPFLKSNTECIATAQRLLAESTRLKSSLDFSFVPNPLIEVGDIVELEYTDGSVEKHIIRSLSISIGAEGGMSSSTAADSNTQAEMSVM